MKISYLSTLWMLLTYTWSNAASSCDLPTIPIGRIEAWCTCIKMCCNPLVPIVLGRNLTKSSARKEAKSSKISSALAKETRNTRGKTQFHRIWAMTTHHTWHLLKSLLNFLCRQLCSGFRFGFSCLKQVTVLSCLDEKAAEQVQQAHLPNVMR